MSKVFAPTLAAVAIALAVTTPWVDSHQGTDAGLVTQPASDSWAEVPLLPEDAYLPPAGCHAVALAGASDEAVAWLQEQGWQGKAGDGQEALYPPGC